MVLFITLNRVVVDFDSQVCPFKEKLFSKHFCNALYYAEQGGSNFSVRDEILNCDHSLKAIDLTFEPVYEILKCNDVIVKLLSSTFMKYGSSLDFSRVEIYQKRTLASQELKGYAV